MKMTLPLWCLCIFVLWTMLIVVMLIAARLQHLSVGGSPRDFGDPVGNKLLWRLWRSQANCAENLPLYASIVLLLTIRGIANGAIDGLAVTYISLRLFHSLVHIFGLNPNIRVACLGIQFICLLGLLGYGVH